MSDLNKVFEDIVAVSQGNLDVLSSATEKFAREVTTTSSQMPRDSALPSPAPAAEHRAERSAG